MLADGADDPIGDEHRLAGRNLADFAFVRPAADKGKQVQNAVAGRRVAALANSLQIEPAGGKIGLPGHDGGKRAFGVVVVPVRRFAQNTVQIRPHRHAAISVFGVLLVQLRARLDDLLLLGVHLQAVGLRVPAIAHQVRQRQGDADQDFFVILARVGPLGVVRQIGQRGFREVLLLQVIEPVANLAQRLLGLGRAAGEQLCHRQIEFGDVLLFAGVGQEFFQLQRRLLRLPAKVQVAGASDAIRVSRAAGGDGQQQDPEAGTEVSIPGQGRPHGTLWSRGDFDRRFRID